MKCSLSSRASWLTRLRCFEPRRQVVMFRVGPATEPHTGGELYNVELYQALNEAGYCTRVLPWTRRTLTDNLICIPTTLGSLALGNRVTIISPLFSPSKLILYFALCRMLPRCRLVTIVFHLESDEGAASRSRLRLLERMTLLLSHEIVVISPVTAQRVTSLGVVGRQFALIPPGIDLTLGTPTLRRPGVTRLLTVGKLTRRKAIDQLLLALRDLPETFELDLAGTVGEPDYEPYLRQFVRDGGLETRVRFHGFVTPTQLGDLRASADIYVSASVWEGFGMAVAEAIAAGLPVVAVDSGPTRDLVQDEGVGLVVRPGDTAALTAAILTVAGDPTYRQEAAARAPAVRQKYSWEAMRRSFVTLIDDLWNKPSPTEAT